MLSKFHFELIIFTHITFNICRSNGNIVDSFGKTIKCYPEVPQVLETLIKEGYQLGVASRTGEIDGAKQLLKLFDWDRHFRYKEIYPGSKVTHFNRYS